MVFPSETGKGGHSAEKYATRTEALRVPLVFMGPGVEELNLGDRWSEMDIAPTVLDLLNISANLSGDGRSLPVAESYELRVRGAPGAQELWRDGAMLAEGSADDCCFRGLARGMYSLKADGKEWAVLVNGDVAMDLAGKAAPESNWKRIIGIILILAINLVGIIIIVRIWKKGS
jgi:arylsulfatase A-like enzyme